jgi:hypothetical protein
MEFCSRLTRQRPHRARMALPSAIAISTGQSRLLQHVICFPLSVACRPPHVVSSTVSERCMLSAAQCPMHAVCCTLSIARCLLHDVCHTVDGHHIETNRSDTQIHRRAFICIFRPKHEMPSLHVVRCMWSATHCPLHVVRCKFPLLTQGKAGV